MDGVGRSLRSMTSVDTFVSLLYLEPSPMDSPTMPATDKDLPPLPEELMNSTGDMSGSPSASTSTLGLRHGPLFYLNRIQKYSTYTITVFASIHFATTAVIPLLNNSVAASESALLLAREIYQTPTTEPLLVGLPIIAHVTSGIVSRLIRRSQNLKRYGSAATPGMWAHHSKKSAEKALRTGSVQLTTRIWPQVSYISASGYVFSCLLGAHVVMNRLLPILVEGNSSSTGLAFVAHGFAKHGVMPWIAYTGLVGVGCAHMVWGWAKWVGAAPSLDGIKSTTMVDRQTRRRRRRVWWSLHAISTVTAGVWAAGGLGVVAKGGVSEGWVGKLYDEMYAKVYL